MKKTLGFVLLVLCFNLNFGFSQNEISPVKMVYKSLKPAKMDTNSFINALSKGQLVARIRLFQMNTINKSELKNFSATAAGFGMHYQTRNFKGFGIAIGAFDIQKIGSENIQIPDVRSSQISRYETGLFYGSHKNTLRLEELNLKFENSKLTIILGRQFINTPFINLQDGRMSPTAVSGWVSNFKIKPTFNLHFSLISAISPRNIQDFKSVGGSIGIYPSGVNKEGVKSNYAGNTSSRGALNIGFDMKVSPDIKVKFWNLYVDNIFNTELVQIDFNKKINKNKVFGSLQTIGQQALGNGGNANASLAYISPNSRALTFGAKMGCAVHKTELSLNYNRITAKGRYLMPREWGIDPFFTFLARERNEGFGDVHAVVLKAKHLFFKDKLETNIGLGRYKLPDVKNYRLNKYGMPSYSQLNADFKYDASALIKNLNIQFLAVYKLKQGNDYNTAKYVINKVDMWNLNTVLNYYF